MPVIAFSSAIGPVRLDCTVSEKHTSTIEITENPIETGAKINDHAYIEPKRVSLDVADQGGALTFQALVRFQETRVPFTLVTGLNVYRNMLIKSIDADRDATFSKVLRARIDLQEALIVSTATAAVDGNEASQTSKGAAGGKKSTSAASPSKSLAKGRVTAARATGTVVRGDSPTATVPAAKQSSILKSVFGS